MIVNPWEVALALALGCYILYSCCKSVIHVGEEVIALVPADVGYVDGQSECHG